MLLAFTILGRSYATVHNVSSLFELYRALSVKGRLEVNSDVIGRNDCWRPILQDE
jgi:hypothetical protein